jgi:uncharacterized protein YraI
VPPAGPRILTEPRDQPAAWSGHTWITYWWSGGPTIQQSDQMQAIVQGYNRSSPVPPTYYVFGTGGVGLTERTGPGLNYGSAGSLLEGQQIQISCQQQSGSAVGGSDIWDRLTNGNWVSDFYTTTPVYAAFSPGIPQCSSPPPPPPVNTSYHVYETGGLGLNERTGPGLAFPGVGALPYGGTVDIACQWRSGSYANGSSIWDQLANGTWVADGYVNTPAVDQFTSGIPHCASAPSTPSYAYPIPQSYGRPGSTPYGHNPTSVKADPVNTLTGAYWTQDTDLQLPGIGVPFALTRAYTSINQAGGPFGPGWTFGYQMQLTQGDKGDLTLTTDQGAQLAFQMGEHGPVRRRPGRERDAAPDSDRVRGRQERPDPPVLRHLRAPAGHSRPERPGPPHDRRCRWQPDQHHRQRRPGHQLRACLWHRPHHVGHAARRPLGALRLHLGPADLRDRPGGRGHHL